MKMTKKDTMKKHNVKNISLGNFRVKLGQKHGQPERLSPEDHFTDIGKMVCDSPNTANKKKAVREE